LPIFLKYFNFYISLLGSIFITIISYYIMISLLQKFNISL
jgi:hypothetical protein